MLGLRTADGLDLRAVRRDHGQAAVDALLPVLRRREQQGLVELHAGGGGGGEQAPTAAAGAAAAGPAAARGGGGGLVPIRARLTDPAGFLVSNDIISDLFAVL